MSDGNTCKGVFGFVLFMDVSGMDFPDVVNMFVTKMVVSCFDSFLLVCSTCDRSAFMLTRIHFGGVFLWIGGFYLKRGQGLFYFLEICPELSAPRT